MFSLDTVSTRNVCNGADAPTIALRTDGRTQSYIDGTKAKHMSFLGQKQYRYRMYQILRERYNSYR